MNQYGGGGVSFVGFYVQKRIGVAEVGSEFFKINLIVHL